MNVSVPVYEDVGNRYADCYYDGSVGIVVSTQMIFSDDFSMKRYCCCCCFHSYWCFEVVWGYLNDILVLLCFCCNNETCTGCLDVLFLGVLCLGVLCVGVLFGGSNSNSGSGSGRSRSEPTEEQLGLKRLDFKIFSRDTKEFFSQWRLSSFFKFNLIRNGLKLNLQQFQ